MCQLYLNKAGGKVLFTVSPKMKYFSINLTKHVQRDFPGGTLVKNLPSNAGDTSSSPGPGRSHMPQSN